MRPRRSACRSSPRSSRRIRWRDWAAPDGAKRRELTNGAMGSFLAFVNGACCPTCAACATGRARRRARRSSARSSARLTRSRVDTEKNLLDILDRVDEIRQEAVDQTHVFTLSQAYEGLLLKMGEKNNDGGQFFTPREVIRAMVRVDRPAARRDGLRPGLRHGRLPGPGLRAHARRPGRRRDRRAAALLREETFCGREKEDLIYPIALANLVLHGIDQPHIWHGNTLTAPGGLRRTVRRRAGPVRRRPDEPAVRRQGGAGGADELRLQDGRHAGALPPARHRRAQAGRPLRDGDRRGRALPHERDRLRPDQAQAARRDCDLWCIVSLPPGVFSSAGAGVKTNLLFFTKGGPTERIWYFDLSDVKVDQEAAADAGALRGVLRAAGGPGGLRPARGR